MKPCISINVFFDDTFTVPVNEQIRRVADAGFTHIDMNFWDWSHSPDSPFKKDNWRDWIRFIGTSAARMGMTFTQSHAHVYNFYNFDKDNPHEEQILRSIEGTGMLGIRWVVLHPSQRADWAEEGSLQKMMDENTDYFRRLADYAADFNCGIALENMSSSQSGLTTASQLCELIDRIDRNNVGACWDTGHANLAHQDQSASIHTLGSRLHALHIADNYGVHDDHMPPYFGTVDWPSVVAALHDIAYDGDFTFESHNLVRKMPDSCGTEALRLNYQIGKSLVALEETL